ncbi:hypothetical protein BGE01nite_31930 [Brevifollis gellanilyticus]|uniref:Uncharacterized protein n=2 Tax=Brevifollis gellanilyticus TaxID=748831 RepID=A0A512MAZ2_9BACT|nr:hypothetical protein BGE01nite_31930 [Brevifollis gellanilyticus]
MDFVYGQYLSDYVLADRGDSHCPDNETNTHHTMKKTLASTAALLLLTAGTYAGELYTSTQEGVWQNKGTYFNTPMSFGDERGRNEGRVQNRGLTESHLVPAGQAARRGGGGYVATPPPMFSGAGTAGHANRPINRWWRDLSPEVLARYRAFHGKGKGRP